MSTVTTSYYAKALDFANVDALKAELEALLSEEISSAEALEQWLKEEYEVEIKVHEVLAGHQIDFYRDTANEEKKQIHMHDQTAVVPLLMQYSSKLNEKFCTSPYAKDLDEDKYGLMRQVRSTELELFREENIPLKVKEQELIAKYNEIIGGLTAGWDGEQKPFPFVQAQLDSPDRAKREQAWHSMVAARKTIKSDIDEMMNELVQLRHQMAINAGFDNYRDYSFRAKNREYSVQDCRDFHESVEQYVIPMWDRLAESFKQELGVDTYRPWDISPCTLPNAPFDAVEQLMDGVQKMLSETDSYFGDRFAHMRANGLLDLESRKGKAPGGFCSFLPYSQNTFVFANFSPSFFALIALIHEMGHAVNGYLQVREQPEWSYHRAEIAELYSHGMELLCLDKLDEFYTNETDLKNAQRELLHRALNMLMGPLSGDLFQHWMYENPEHTAKERDEKYREIVQRFVGHPVNYDGLEDEVGKTWINTIHFIAYPFYNIEYAMSEVGALQLLKRYQDDPADAIAGYKRGATADYRQSIAQVYEQTGVSFDFSADAVKDIAVFLEGVIGKLA